MNKSSARSMAVAARVAFGYLSAIDPLPATPVDAVIGFGVFDLDLPKFCGELFRQRVARNVIFTGGIGAGTADLGGPEADIWRAELLRSDPGFPAEHLILENRSTNTTENIQCTAELLQRDYPHLVFGTGIKSAIIVASPSRLRRVKLAMMHWHPGVRLTRSLPGANYEREQQLYASKGHDYVEHLTGELDRIVSYPARGWIADEPLPADIAEVHAVLRGAP